MTKDILLITCDMETFHHINREINIEKGSVYHVDTVDEAIWKMQMHSFCLVILDIPLSDRTGFERIEAIRQISPIPILVLSNERGGVERVKALENGADDFLQKPYELDECMARIRALLRRYTELNYITENHYEIVSQNGMLLDTGRRLLSVNGKEIGLTPKEYGILELLMKNRRQIMTYEQIYEAVWKEPYIGNADKEVVFYQMGQLRRKIGKERIESVYGTGYRMKEETTE